MSLQPDIGPGKYRHQTERVLREEYADGVILSRAARRSLRCGSMRDSTTFWPEFPQAISPNPRAHAARMLEPEAFLDVRLLHAAKDLADGFALG